MARMTRSSAARLGALEHRVPDPAHVVFRVAGALHLGLVEVEHLLERLPLAHGREVGRGARVGGEAHGCGWVSLDGFGVLCCWSAVDCFCCSMPRSIRLPSVRIWPTYTPWRHQPRTTAFWWAVLRPGRLCVHLITTEIRAEAFRSGEYQHRTRYHFLPFYTVLQIFPRGHGWTVHASPDQDAANHHKTEPRQQLELSV